MAISKKVKIKESSPAQLTRENNFVNEEIVQNDGQLAVDVFENESDFVVMAAIAGISSKDVEIQLDKDMLIVKGCRPNPEINGQKNYFFQECHWGTFSRKIILPENVNIAEAQADFDKGILMVKLPKQLNNNKKDISIKEN